MSDVSGAGDAFTRSYLSELEALRREGADFADRYPKIAGRLKLGDEASPDPHVERLLESFAFLTARVQRKLDDDYPQLSQSLLEVLYPQLTRPIPSMAVAEIGLDYDQSIPAAGRAIPAGTPFVSKPVRGEPLRFRSTAPARLWPIKLVRADVTPPRGDDLARHARARSVLTLHIESVGAKLSELELDELDIYLKGEPATVHEIYDLLGGALVGLEAGGKLLDRSSLEARGFSDEEAMLPYPLRTFAGYRLLQEYFAFPAKFHFLRLTGLAEVRRRSESKLDLRFLLSREPRVPTAGITAENFSLNCVPLINLFEANADPIVISPFVDRHPVVPDAQRPLDLEVYSVLKVEGVRAGESDRTSYAPFFSLHHGDEKRLYWRAAREHSQRKGDEGTDVFLSLVDLDLDPSDPVDRTLHLRVLCTNRDLPFTSGQWGRPDDFRVEGVAGVAGVRCVHRPTKTLRPAGGGGRHWRLVSQLSLNHLSLVSEGRDALREILRVYDVAGTAANREQVEGILDVKSRPVSRWLRGEFGGGFVRGMRTTLTLDRDRFVGGSALLFASVIERFLALYGAINSFSELSLETPQDQGETHRWKPRAGARPLL
ncbi:MAG: type VI secretion system baseplate subunit TssF [Planctomycetota bacterium]